MSSGAWTRLLLACVVAAHVVGALQLAFVCDDAFISFRYARHLAEGHGLVFNIGEQPPVEGYSNLLWVLIAAVVHAGGGDIVQVMPALSIGCAAWLLQWHARIGRGLALDRAAALLATVTLAASPGFVVWSTGGLETMAETLALFIIFEGLILSPRPAWRALAAGIALVLLRTEGVGWVVVCAALAVGVHLAAGTWRESWRRLTVITSVALMSFATHVGWRYATYGQLVANTTQVKVHLGVESALRGLDYVAGFWLATIAPAVPLLLAVWVAVDAVRDRQGDRSRTARVVAVAAMTWGVPLYAILVGGDFMTMGRMLVPGLPFGALCLGVAMQRLTWRKTAMAVCVIVSVVGALPLGDVHLVPEAVRRDFRVRFNSAAFRSEIGQWRYMRNNARSWSELGAALSQIEAPGDGIVLGAIGAVGFYCELFVYDRYGLVSPDVAQRAGDGRAHSPGHDKYVPVHFFLDQNPRFLRANLLRGAAPPERVTAQARGWRATPAMQAGWAPRAYPLTLHDEAWTLVVLERQADAAAEWRRLDSESP